MFLRVTKAKNNNYVCIVKSYRNADGKPRQKIIQNLGSFKTEAERERLYILGQNILKSTNGEMIFTSKDIIEIRRENWGVAAVFDQIFSLYQLPSFLEKITKKRKITYNLIDCLKFMIAIRHIEPMSKLACFYKRHNFAGFGDFELQHLYRTLDELHHYENELKDHLFHCQKTLYSTPIDVVFFDVTTLYFQSQQDNKLRDFGYSKDCKFNEVQIVCSLMVASDNRPIGYDIFPGNEYEGNTLLESLEKLRSKYQIRKVIIVADRGMSSFENLQGIKEMGFEYIIASRLRNLSADMQKQVLDTADYQILYEAEEEITCYKKLSINREKIFNNEDGKRYKSNLLDNLLCLYSSKRAKKDAKDRDRLVEKAQEILDSGHCNNKRGAKKYLNIEKQTISGLNWEKIHESAQYDGFYLISYSDPTLTPNAVASTYHGLWQIEASFRSMKHFFRARPMFHWTPERISGHMMLNFICLIFKHFISYAIQSNTDAKLSEQNIRNALRDLQRSVVDIQGTKSFLYSQITNEQDILLKSLKIKTRL